MKILNELSDGEIEQAFFDGMFYTKCKCGHYSGEHENCNGKCKICFCKCTKFEREEKKIKK